MIPTARLWTSICLIAVPTMAAGFVPGIWPLALLLDFLLLFLGLADFLLARKVPLTLWRELPGRLSVGAPNRVDVHVVHSGPRAVFLQVKDDFPAEVSAEPDVLSLLLSPKSRAKLSYRATPQKRGKFHFGDLNVRLRGPFGLTWQERVVSAAQPVSVFPDLRGARRLLLSDAALDLVNLGLRQLRRDGRGSEFARLRDYAQGDSAREVDWKATARRGRPVTRVMESERSQSVLICVDAGRSMAARVEGLTKLDRAVNAALFLAFVAVRNGDRVGLAVFADGVKAYLAPNSGRTQYRKIVDTLYSAKPHLTYVDFLALFKELNLRLRRRSLLCVFTDFLDEDQASTMVYPLQRLARRHVPLCLSVKDTALSALLSTPPPSAEEAFQHAVASELLHEREQMKARIGQEGVQMIDVHPEELSLAAVNRYLEIKARGAL
ncbi:MAG: DUF58 domain-containing protein [Myxococcota bacterium]